jgi:hypothetical protein
MLTVALLLFGFGGAILNGYGKRKAELAFADLHALSHQLREIEHAMAGQTGEALDKTLRNYQRVQHEFDLAGGYAWRHRLEATLLGVGTLIFGVLGVFTQLQDALNLIWRVPPQPAKGWWRYLHRRLCSLATVLITGFLLLVSLVASAMLSWR